MYGKDRMEDSKYIIMVTIGDCMEKKWTKQKVYTKLLTDNTDTDEGCCHKVSLLGRT